MRNLLLFLAGICTLASCAALRGGSTSDVVHVVTASGGAWGAAKLAREAMQSVDGIDELRMSGTRATFTISKGTSIDESALASAFEERGMKLETYETVERPRPAARYTADAAITWAVTIGKVRAALVEVPGVIDAYFEKEIEILVAAPGELDEEKIGEVLGGFEIEYTGLERKG